MLQKSFFYVSKLIMHSIPILYRVMIVLTVLKSLFDNSYKKVYDMN